MGRDTSSLSEEVWDEKAVQDGIEREGRLTFNPFTPKPKQYILPTFQKEMYTWDSENLQYNRLSSEWALQSEALHIVWCYNSCEAAGEMWSWSLLGVKGLKDKALSLRRRGKQ